MADEQQAKQPINHTQDVLTLLNRDLANEMNTMLMYMATSLLVKGNDAGDVRETTDTFAKQDFKHARKLAARIVELEGTPQLMPGQLQDNASVDVNLPRKREKDALLKDSLEREMLSVIEYRNQIQNIAFTDPATRRLLEEILAEKESQAKEIRVLLGEAM